MTRTRCWWFGVALLLLLPGCYDPPKLDALVEAKGPERTVVAISGSNLLLAEIVWDVDRTTETVLPGGFLSATMFSVPPGVITGSHPVALRNAYGWSEIRSFEVTEPVPIGGPRIDHVTLLTIDFDAATARPALYVQGANIDVGAVVRIDGADVATTAHRALQTELYGAVPEDLGYPIRHYVSLIALPGDLSPGPISVSVRNLDGAVSDSVSYTIPGGPDGLDRDGDNLPDAWELEGYDADGDGSIDVDLPALGASPLRRDVLVEVDTMQDLDHDPIGPTGTDPGVFEAAQAMFLAAPILNPEGEEGINLILDTSGSVPFHSILAFNTVADGTEDAKYADLKSAYFDNAARGRVYHYAIWGNMLPCSYSGISDRSDATGNGDDFVVAFDDFPTNYFTLRTQVETFVHELGHDLGLRHGGDTADDYKPNYWSAMSYTWMHRSAYEEESTRRLWPTCEPIYWADASATEIGPAPSTINAILDFSHGMGRQVDERALDEAGGVCGFAVDWNGDGHTTGTGLSFDANDDGDLNDVLDDFADWRALNYRGPESNGGLTP